jgi:hypothetical protein
MEFDIRVPGDGDLILADGEIFAGAAGETRTTARGHRTLDDLGTKATLGQEITPAEVVGALEAAERVAIIGREATSVQVAPAEA